LRVGRLLLLAGCFGLFAGGCESDLELELDNLACNDNDRCAKGYACQKDAGICVRNSPGEPWAPGGSGGGGSGGMPGGGGSGHGGVDGNAGAGGNAGLAGQGGGAGGSDDLDAGPPVLIDGGPDGCVPTTVYRDRDNDGFGDEDDSAFGCPRSGWVADGTDCRDDIRAVNPGQTGFFAEGYPVPGGTSFDYDCSDAEEPSLDNDLDAVPPCTGLGLTCDGTNGMLPATEPPRQGAGVDPRCGSTSRRDCEYDGLLGSCTPVNTTLGEAFVCH
jgi:hypothetical protein